MPLPQLTALNKTYQRAFIVGITNVTYICITFNRVHCIPHAYKVLTLNINGSNIHLFQSYIANTVTFCICSKCAISKCNYCVPRKEANCYQYVLIS